MKTIHSLISLLVLAAFPALVAAQSFNIPWFSVDGGGATSTGGLYSVSGSIGQPDASVMSGGTYTCEGGFWAGIQPSDAAVLVPTNSVWKYLGDGSDQGTAWRSRNFNDSAWLSGAAQLGYGDGDETTVVPFGPDPNNKYITTYFRHAFNVPNLGAIPHLCLRLLRDDGAVVYLNGTEVFRDNLPAGPVDYRTLATNALDDGTVFLEALISTNALVPGTNFLAVEIHQQLPWSTDLSFALELSVPSPLGPLPLSIRLGVGNTVILSWPNPSTCYVLQQTPTMTGAGGGWRDVTQPPVIVGSFKEVTLPAIGGACLFRLRGP